MAPVHDPAPIQERSAILGDRLLGALVAGIGVIVLINLAGIAYITATDTTPATMPAGLNYAMSGVGLLVVTGIVWWWLEPDKRAAAFPLEL